MNFLGAYWDGVRPYLLKIAIDFSVSASFYLGLYLFQGLANFLPVGGWAGELIENLHATGIIVALVVFAVLSVNDIIQIREKREHLCLV